MNMKNWIEGKFKLSELQTDIHTELLAGFATFTTMAYVLATVPNILGDAGFDKKSVLLSMILLIVLTTLAMALYTNLPFAMAPGLGSVSIVAGMILNEKVSPEIAAGVIFLSGVLFIVISFLGLREAVVRVIPSSLKYAVSASIGLFIALIGAKSCGLIVANEAKKGLSFGNLMSPSVILAAIGFLIILFFKAKKISTGMIYAILCTTAIGIPMGVTKLPSQIISMPAGIGSQFLKIDILGAMNVAYLPFIIALFIPDFFSSFGTALGVGGKAGYLDKDGNLPGLNKIFHIDAIAAAVGGLFCMPNMVTYLESTVGVEAGGRTGLTVIGTSIMFILMVFFTPIAIMIPSAATAPVLIVIGVGMLSSIKNINFDDMTEYFPAFLCITFTIFANNIANGVCLAIPVYAFLKIASGRSKELSKVLFVMVAICILYFSTIIK